MTLTPDDVRNKHFKAAFRGYAEEEVDTFLDEVEVELSRLHGENDTLRQRIEVLQSAPPPQPVHSEAEEMLRRTLLLAQRTADETVAEARADAQRMVEEARQQADTTIQQAESQAAASIGDLERRRQALEQHIDGLRAFEREYRTRLKAYLESQLRDLDGRPSAPDGGEPSPGTTGGSLPSFGGASAGGAGGSGTEPADAPEPDAPQAPAPAPVPVAPTPTSFARTPFTSPPQGGSYDADEDDSDVPRLSP